MRRIWPLLLIFFLLFTGARGGISRGGGAVNPGIKYPWRFAYVTDTHINWNFGGITPRNSYMFARCIDTLNTLQQTDIGMDLLVFGGDWSEDIFTNGIVAGVDTFLAIKARSRFPWYPVIGNWEAIPSDTAEQVSPYRTAINRFPEFFGGNTYWNQDWKNVRFISLQDIPSYNIGDPADYLRNNPTSYAPPTGGIQGYDYDGISVSTSPQRVMLQNAVDTRGSKWVVAAAHRPSFGSDQNSSNRLNYRRNYRQNSWIHDIESRLGTGERGLCLLGDQHLSLWFTKAIYDSAVASATGKGLYHLIVSSGGASRSADTTEMLGGSSLAAFTYSTGARNYGRTSAAWSDTVTTAGDPKVNFAWTFSLFTVYGDHILVETFRVFDGVTPASKTLGFRTRLMDRRTISRDN